MQHKRLHIALALFAAGMSAAPSAFADDVIIAPTRIQFYNESAESGQQPGDPMYIFKGSMEHLRDQSGLIHFDGSSFGYVDRTTILDDYIDAVPTHIFLNNPSPGNPDYPWGPFDGLQDVGVALGYDSAASLFGPYWAGFDLGASHTVTSIVVWNSTLDQADLWTGGTLTPDPDLYVSNLFAFAVSFPDASELDVGFTNPDQDNRVATLLKPFVYKFTQPVTTRYISALFPTGPKDYVDTYEIAFGIQADPLPVTLDLGDTPLPVTVPGQLSAAENDLTDATPFILQPGQRISEIVIDLLELTEPAPGGPFPIPVIHFWLEDDQGNVLSSIGEYFSDGTYLLDGLPAHLDPGEYRLVGELFATSTDSFARYAYTITTVPEPGTAAAMALGAMLMLKRKRKRLSSLRAPTPVRLTG